MPFLLFTPLAFVLLQLTVRLRFRTALLLSVVLGLVGDFIVDLILVARR